MTKKETIKRLIKLLIDTANGLPKYDWWDYINTNKTDRGICWLASKRLGVDIYDEEWTGYWQCFEVYTFGYWIKPFGNAETREELLQLIETRIFILTMELESGVE